MAQHDFSIANDTGANVRTDLNNVLAAIVSQNSGATEPTTTFAFMWWFDTTTSLLKIRNAANNAWVTIGSLSGNVWTVYGPQPKLDATVAPGVSNDNTEGYAPGSVWVDVTNDLAYICLDASTGAAVWTEITQASGGGQTTSARVNRSTAQTISNATWTAISFDTEDFDVGGMAEQVTNPSRITIPAGEGGKYLVTGIALWTANATGQRAIRLRKNGTTDLADGARSPTDAATNVGTPFCDIVNLAAADYIELMVYQSSGGNLDLIVLTPQYPYFAAHRLS